MNQMRLVIPSMILCASITTAVQGQDSNRPTLGPAEADGHRSIQIKRPVKPGDEVGSFAQRFGVDWVALDEIRLRAIDHVALLEEDDQFDPMPLRFAVPRNVGIESTDGRWIEVQGGWL